MTITKTGGDRGEMIGGDSLPGVPDIPGYYDAYMEQEIDRINKITDSATGRLDAFIFVTDYHALKNAGNSPALIQKIVSETGINMVVFGGDAYQPSTKPDKKAEYGRGAAKVYSTLASTTDNFCPLIGNHEYNHWKSNQELEWKVEETAWKQSSLLRMCLRHREGINEFGDFAVRDELSKVIHVFIQMDGDHNSVMGQFVWLADVLNRVEDGWGVVVFRHHVYTKGSSANTFESRPRRNARMISKLLMAYIQRQRKVIKNPTGNPEKAEESQTFDFRKARGEVICMIGGHLHRDTHVTREDSAEGILTIVTAGDLCWHGNKLYTYIDTYGDVIERTPGTIREQAFDVVQIDRDKRVVYCTRIGGGVDRQFKY